ncbi:uncharacterized protein DUF4249 [Larkinella arboricola]|uniref:Uncharacterized protein DUF4249 n=1 Tax=Larkinella arboricola TaxID=643671 RepID=A0A327X9H0_LARAB|nr:DUF4249 domain-containing protein [Larkinella arboricola]RAK02503.1 uncharacterized protein DUF4249 [Larkinella arboricola]
MVIRSILLSVLLVFGTMACQNLVTEIDPSRLPQMDRKLVVNGYLSPQDTVLAVSVSSSQTVLGDIVGDSVNTVGEATVTIRSEGKAITLAYDPAERAYLADARRFPIQAGKTYTVQVDAPGFETVTSSCTVPQAVPVAELKLDSTRNYTDSGIELTWTYGVRVVWQDPAGETNFYRVVGYGECLSRIPPTGTAHIDSTTPKVLTRGIIGFGRLEQFISDRNQDGQRLVSARGEVPRFFDYAYYDSTTQQTYSGSHFYTKPLTLRLSVLQTDENYYRYHRARQQQRQSQGNPFAEPILMPSNIQGGLGCFAAYNRSTMEVRL